MEAVRRIRELAGKTLSSLKAISDGNLLDEVFGKYDIDAVYILQASRQ